jgi:hypothetical protein
LTAKEKECVRDANKYFLTAVEEVLRMLSTRRATTPGASSQWEEAPGVGYVPPSKPCRWRGTQIHHGGGVCELCVSGVSLAKSFPSGSFSFPPERT